MRRNRTKNPNLEQLTFLKERGIIPPSTEVTCRDLINFILRGKCFGYQSETARIEAVLMAQKKWLGKEVIDTYNNFRTRVIGVTARKPQEVASFRLWEKREGPIPSSGHGHLGIGPLLFAIKDERDRTKWVGTIRLRLIETVGKGDSDNESRDQDLSPKE